jgi:hypothetical protein
MLPRLEEHPLCQLVQVLNGVECLMLPLRLLRMIPMTTDSSLYNLPMHSPTGFETLWCVSVVPFGGSFVIMRALARTCRI